MIGEGLFGVQEHVLLKRTVRIGTMRKKIKVGKLKFSMDNRRVTWPQNYEGC